VRFIARSQVRVHRLEIVFFISKKYPHVVYRLVLVSIFISNLSFAQTTVIENDIKALATDSELNYKDFEGILVSAKKATIIGLSEATHGKNEPLNFRNGLIKALVKKKLIDVVALESGTTEGKILYDYVLNQGTYNDLNEVLKSGFSWRFYVIPQNEELISWLRQYNADKTNSHKVKIYGFDIPGSPGNPNVDRKMSTAFGYALDYLKLVDTASYTDFKQRIEPFLPYVHINFDDPSTHDKQFSGLSDNERLRFLDACLQLIKHFQTRQTDYTNRSSKEQFDWAYLSALNAQQVLNWLSYIPYGYVPPSDNGKLVNSDIFHSIFNYRDRAMFDNLNWIIEREPGSRLFVFASTNHLLKTPIFLTDTNSTIRQKNVLGNYLSSKYGDKYFLIGNIVANNTIGQASIENIFLDSKYDHYYKSLYHRRNSNNNWASYYYQTKESKTDLFNGMDVLLFDKQQTTIIFRE
jgi:erythromycin esterase-like protein